MRRFSIADLRGVLLVLGRGVTRDHEKGTMTVKINRAVWYDKLLPYLFTGPADREATEQRGQAALSGYHGQRDVPCTGDSQ